MTTEKERTFPEFMFDLQFDNLRVMYEERQAGNTKQYTKQDLIHVVDELKSLTDDM